MVECCLAGLKTRPKATAHCWPSLILYTSDFKKIICTSVWQHGHDNSKKGYIGEINPYKSIETMVQYLQYLRNTVLTSHALIVPNFSYQDFAKDSKIGLEKAKK